MRHLILQESDRYPVALLLKSTSFLTDGIKTHYANPLVSRGVPLNQQIAMTLEYPERGKKLSVKMAKDYVSKLLPALRQVGTELLYCTDTTYFKVLTKKTKAEPHMGYVLPCAIEGFEDMQVTLGVNFQSLFYNPDLQAKLDLSLDALASYRQGTYSPLGEGIIHHAEYPKTLEAIRDALYKLHQYPALSADIEGFSLQHWLCGIGSIAFAWNQHEGLAFLVDYEPLDEPVWDTKKQTTGLFGRQGFNHEVRKLLLEFLLTYRGTLRWHRAAFDVKVLIYQLWMSAIDDTDGLLRGLEAMTRNFDCTLVMSYLATNSCAGNELSLKAQAHEFAGNWAQEDIKDIRRIRPDDLLQYNLVDCLSTNYTFDKHYPTLIADEQMELYQGFMKDSLRVLINTMLNGMPVYPARVKEARDILEAREKELLATITALPLVKTMDLLVQRKEMEKANAKLKTKQHPLEHFAHHRFKPSSNQQVQALLYEQMGLPVIDRTDSGQPAVGMETLEKLINHCTNPEYREVIQALIDLTGVTKILSSFIPPLEGAVPIPGTEYALLFGNFNLGGTVSGRLSSSDPNLQNLPAKGPWGKLIKSCFAAQPGWLFGGSDFASLEDRINALLTKDKNKLKVYTDGYDGHSLRAFAYFPEQLPGIVNTVESINSIKKLFEPVRDDSKAPTFLLTYGGSYLGLMKNLGWPKEKALRIESNYHTLYVESGEWVKARIDEAAEQGYAVSAFGLRIRAPLLKQTLRGRAKCPHEAEAEARTLGNAISGQSYGLLTNRAANAFMAKVWASPYRLDILPVAFIHDAIYLLIRNKPEVVEWVNRELILEMQWQELPEIAHDEVKLGAELDLFFPNWAHPVTLPNGAGKLDIVRLCKAHVEALQEKGVLPKKQARTAA